MLRRDTPQNDNNELSETLRRLARASGGAITVSLDGRPIARIGSQSRSPAAGAGTPPAADDTDA